MKYLFIILLLLNSLTTLFAQIDPKEGCNLTTIQIASSSEEVIVMRHAGSFIFLPSTGQETLWEISTTAHEGNIATSTEEHFVFDLPDHGTSIADSVVVDLTMTNGNGDVCSIRDTLVWTLVRVVNTDPPVELFDWYNLDSLGNPGVYNQATVSTTSFTESDINVYPNPANGLIHINLGSAASSPYFILVYDAQGRLIDRIPGSALQDGRTDLYLNEPGFYILEIHVGDKVISKKVIIE